MTARTDDDWEKHVQLIEEPTVVQPAGQRRSVDDGDVLVLVILAAIIAALAGGAWCVCWAYEAWGPPAENREHLVQSLRAIDRRLEALEAKVAEQQETLETTDQLNLGWGGRLSDRLRELETEFEFHRSSAVGDDHSWR